LAPKSAAERIARARSIPAGREIEISFDNCSIIMAGIGTIGIGSSRSTTSRSWASTGTATAEAGDRRTARRTGRRDAHPADATPVMDELKNPALESLSCAQRQLLRMGPRNVRLIQQKLREIAPATGIDLATTATR
jgi:hypothetical protein